MSASASESSLNQRVGATTTVGNSNNSSGNSNNGPSGVEQKSAADQVAIITGSASGIGRGTALAFAALNYRLVLVDKNVERLAETAELCRQKSPKGHQVSVS